MLVFGALPEFRRQKSSTPGMHWDLPACTNPAGWLAEVTSDYRIVVAASPCGSRCTARGLPSTAARAMVMPGEGGRGAPTTLGHAPGQANRTIMAREGGGAGALING